MRICSVWTVAKVKTLYHSTVGFLEVKLLQRPFKESVGLKNLR